MKVLLIDDQINVVEGLVIGVNWKRLGVNKIFKAYNIHEAKDVISDNHIDIMICDIEMPLGNGIELLEWVRENFSKIECIFLTAHPEFQYAKAAIKLGSFDYLLQPVKYDELEKVIEKVIKKIVRTTEMNKFYKYGVYLSENKNELVEDFWKDIINGKYRGNEKKIFKDAEQLNIRIDSEIKFIPIVISFMRWQIHLEFWNASDFKYAVNNIIKEVFLPFCSIAIVQNDRTYFTVLVPVSVDISFQEVQLVKCCRQLIKVCIEFLKCSVSCYVGNQGDTDNIDGIFEELISMKKNNVALYSKVFIMGKDRQLEEGSCIVTDMKKWEVLLAQEHNEKLMGEVEEYLEKLVQEEKVNSYVLANFQQDFMQMFYNVKESEGIKAHEIFEDKSMLELYSKALNSIEDLKAAIKYLLKMKLRKRNLLEQKSIIDEVRDYIGKNLEKELSRNIIAESVHLNQEYLSRLFKKEMGISLIDYIINERVRLSKELLLKTNVPVSIIASKVGYCNFSHFSKIFKRETGVTPLEYRQNNEMK